MVVPGALESPSPPFQGGAKPSQLQDHVIRAGGQNRTAVTLGYKPSRVTTPTPARQSTVGGDRTRDRRIRSPLLCPLSYDGVEPAVGVEPTQTRVQTESPSDGTGVAPGRGLEPRLPGPKPGVLPLHHPGMEPVTRIELA